MRIEKDVLVSDRIEKIIRRYAGVDMVMRLNLADAIREALRPLWFWFVQEHDVGKITHPGCFFCAAYRDMLPLFKDELPPEDWEKHP